MDEFASRTMLPSARSEELRARLEAVLEQLVEICRLDGRRDEAVAWSEHLRRLDPYRETHLRALMRLHLDAGDRAAALRTYQSFAELLKRELALDPLPATVALAREIGRDAPPAARDGRDHRRVRRGIFGFRQNGRRGRGG